MTAFGRTVVVSTLLALGLAAPTSATAQTSTADKVTWAGVTLTGACRGGGKAVLTAEAVGDGFDITLTTSGMTDGQRWRGALSIESTSDDDQFEFVPFRRVVDGDGWTVTKHVANLDDPFFGASVFGPGPDQPDSDFLCSILVQPVKPLLGVTTCARAPQLSLTSVTKAGKTVVRWLAYGLKPGSGWTVSVSASDDGTGEATGTTGSATPEGTLRGKATFEIAASSVGLAIKADGGQRCSLRVKRQATPG